ncbi:MAG: L,D-transpeptidase [Ignavibacteriales bacterium]
MYCATNEPHPISVTDYNVVIKHFGSPTTPTPKGTFRIINKQVNPGGPYGARWMGLSYKGVGIHGTNRPGSIGGPVSHGCIRMYNRDVIQLFNTVPVGTLVRIT